MTTIYPPEIALEIQRSRLKRLRGLQRTFGNTDAFLNREIVETEAEIKRLEVLKNLD